MYGHNFGETNDGGENDLAGAQLTFDVLPGFLGGVSLKQGLLWSFNGEDDGFTGRSVAAVGSLRIWASCGRSSPSMAVAYTARVSRTASWSGPEIGLGLDLLENVAMRAFVAYDYQFRQPGVGRRHPLGRSELRHPVLEPTCSGFFDDLRALQMHRSGARCRAPDR